MNPTNGSHDSDPPRPPWWRTRRGRVALVLWCIVLPLALEMGTGYEPVHPAPPPRFSMEEEHGPNELRLARTMDFDGDFTERWSQTASFVIYSRNAGAVGRDILEAIFEVHGGDPAHPIIRTYRQILDPSDLRVHQYGTYRIRFDLRDANGSLPAGKYRGYFIAKKQGSKEPDGKFLARMMDFHVKGDDELKLPPINQVGADERLQFVGLVRQKHGIMRAALDFTNTTGENVSFMRLFLPADGSAEYAETVTLANGDSSRMPRAGYYWWHGDPPGWWRIGQRNSGDGSQNAIVPPGIRVRLLCEWEEDRSGFARFDFTYRSVPDGIEHTLTIFPIEILPADIERALAAPVGTIVPLSNPSPGPTPAPDR